MFFIKNGDEFPLRSCFRKDAERAFADDGAAAFPATDEFYDPEAATICERGESEVLRGGPLGCVLIFVDLNMVRDEAIEVDVGADFIVPVAVVIEGIDLEDLDDELRDIFEIHLQRDLIIERVNFLAGGGELDINAVLERLELGWGKE